MRKKDKFKKKSNKKKRIAITISIILVILISIVFISQTSLFNIKNILVSGNNVISKDNIILASGIKRGENIFNISKNTIEKNLLNHPYIKDIHIKRKLPNDIVIDISERKEYLVYKNNGNYTYLDKEGKVLNNLSELKNKNIPILQSKENLNIEEDNYIKQILQLLIETNEKGYSYKVKKIYVGKNLTKITLKSRIVVELDKIEDIKYKLDFIEKIIKDLNENNVRAKKIIFNKDDNPIVVK